MGPLLTIITKMGERWNWSYLQIARLWQWALELKNTGNAQSWQSWQVCTLYLLQYDVGVDENEEDGEGKRGEGWAQLNK